MSKWKSLGVVYFVLSAAGPKEAWAREPTTQEAPVSQAGAQQATEATVPSARSYVQIGEPKEAGSLLYSRGNAAATSGVPNGEIVYLHGMCGHTVSKCAKVGESTTVSAAVYCPQATTKCEGGGFSWSGDASKQSRDLEAQILRARGPSAVSAETASRSRILVGFSLGGFSALNVARNSKRVTSLVIVGARIRTSAAELRSVGVQRIVLAAGDYDMVASDMRTLSKDLVQQGFSAKFVSLGKIGHDFPADYVERMRPAMEWAEKGTKNTSVPGGDGAPKS